VIHAAVARGAAYAFMNVDTVIEIDVLWQVIYLSPLNGSVGSITFPNRSQSRSSGPHLRMTVHTDTGRRDIREFGGLNRDVAVSAIDSKAACMMLMAERKGLLAGNILHHLVLGTYYEIPDPQDKCQKCHTAGQAEPENRVGYRMKWLGHLYSLI
jgi:hypothetical protein